MRHCAPVIHWELLTSRAAHRSQPHCRLLTACASWATMMIHQVRERDQQETSITSITTQAPPQLRKERDTAA